MIDQPSTLPKHHVIQSMVTTDAMITELKMILKITTPALAIQQIALRKWIVRPTFHYMQ
jgi:hypothetical protein